MRSRLPPDERVSRILATTRQMLAHESYENIVTADIAARCGISTATIYKYFGTKRELLIRVAEMWFEEILGPKAGPTGRSLYERLRYLVWDNLSTLWRDASIVRFVWMDLRPDPAFQSMRVYQLNRAVANSVLRLLEEGVASGELRPGIAPRLLRNMIFGAIEHETWAYLRGQGQFDVDATADGIADVIYEGMRNRTRQRKPRSRGSVAS
jgi:AcrR family transcriptional regulator